MSASVAQKVITVIANAKKIPPESITPDSTFEELRIDSLDGLNVFFELEEAFNITIPDDRAREMRSVGEVITALEQLLAGAAGS